MLTSRLLANVKIFSEISSYCSYSSSGKTNVIKILNSENKYMYGDLLETQKQRRKKALNNVSEQGNVPPAKELETVAGSAIEDKSSQGVSDTQPPKTRIKRSKVLKKSSNVIEENESQGRSEAQLELSSDQFIFKSNVPIREDNYPIINSEKSQIFSEDCVVKTVYNYTFSDPAVKNCMKFPSVSKIIEDTMTEKNKQILERWRKNMVKELGEEGFYKHNEGFKQRRPFLRKLGALCSLETCYKRYFKRRQSLKIRGQEFHTAVLYKVLGKKLEEYSEVTQNALQSLSWLLEQVSHPMAVESVIAHPQLEYKGVFDCVALFRNIPVVIDWKLSDKPKKDLKDTYDAPVQVTAYIGAINHDPNYKWGVDHGLVAVAYTNGDPCDVFLLAPKHCQIYWRHWLLRLERFKARSHLHLDHEIDEKALLL